MDVVPSHVSDDVHGHQCSHSSNWLHYIPSGADTQPVVDPVNGAEIEAGSSQTACNWSFRHYFMTWCHYVLFCQQKPTDALAFNWSGLEANFRYCDMKSTFFQPHWTQWIRLKHVCSSVWFSLTHISPTTLYFPLSTFWKCSIIWIIYIWSWHLVCQLSVRLTLSL